MATEWVGQSQRGIAITRITQVLLHAVASRRCGRQGYDIIGVQEGQNTASQVRAHFQRVAKTKNLSARRRWGHRTPCSLHPRAPETVIKWVNAGNFKLVNAGLRLASYAVVGIVAPQHRGQIGGWSGMADAGLLRHEAVTPPALGRNDPLPLLAAPFLPARDLPQMHGD